MPSPPFIISRARCPPFEGSILNCIRKGCAQKTFHGKFLCHWSVFLTHQRHIFFEVSILREAVYDNENRLWNRTGTKWNGAGIESKPQSAIMIVVESVKARNTQRMPTGIDSLSAFLIPSWLNCGVSVRPLFLPWHGAGRRCGLTTHKKGENRG